MKEYINEEYVKEEMINGKVYFMSSTAHPIHARISGNLFTEFNVFLRGKKCQAYGENLTVIFDNQNKVIPDLVVICDPQKMTHRGYKGIPTLIVEIISPGSMRQDRSLKYKLYESYGVPEYWIVTPKEKTIEQYISVDGKYELHETYSLPDGSEESESVNQIISPNQFPDLKIDLNNIFETLII